MTGNHLINGKWEASPQRFAHRNPATGEPLELQFCEATSRQVDAALAAASEAFAATTRLDLRWPAKLLDTAAERAMDLGDALLERAEAETALPRARLTAERARTVSQLKLFAELVRDGSWVDATIDTADPKRQPIPKPDVRRMYKPRGPVVVFGASNFPFAFSVLGGDTASALAAGNPVVVKGHPSHPGTSELFGGAMISAIESLDVPRGLFALLQGTSHELGAALVKHPVTAAVGFTGSQKAGRALFDLGASRARPIPVFAEMGSLNPLIVMPGALRERGDAIAKGLAGSVLLGVGQFCTKPGVILVIGEADAFIAKLAEEMKTAQPGTMLNQPLRDNFAKRVAAWGRTSGVTVRLASEPAGYALITPSLFETTADGFVRTPELREEAFGPAALIVRCNGIEDVARSLRVIEGSLTGTIHKGANEDARPLLAAVEPIVGRVIFDGYPTGVEVGHAMVHGGPYAATTDPNSTSVGTAAIRRFVRMVAYQNTPDELLPPALQDANPLKIMRTVDGKRVFP
jgi:NADP-dependent aldehyde dehydrogenase